MPLIRTPRGLQWVTEEEATAETEIFAPAAAPATRVSLWDRFIKLSKDLVPLLPLAFSALSWLSIRYLTTDRMQQQQMDDHVAIGLMKEQMGKVNDGLSAMRSEQANMSGKLELIVRLTVNKDSK